MALSDVEICSRSLIRLGAKPIDSFADGTDKAQACKLIYTSVLEAELSIYPWRFAMKKVQLARHTDTPTNEWKYAYQLPSDRIGGIFALFDSGQTGAHPRRSFEVFGDKVFADYEEVYVDYPFKPTEPEFPAYFVEFLVLAIAANLAVPITDQANLEDQFRTRAYGLPSENGGGGAIARARNADSRQQPPQTIDDEHLIAARF